MVIDLELAARNDQFVFWTSRALPPDVAARARGFNFLDDLWQLGMMIRGTENDQQDAINRQIYELAEGLVQRTLNSAADALGSLAHL